MHLINIKRPSAGDFDSRNDTSDGNENTHDGLVANRPAGGHPAQGDDGARLDVADHSARDRARLRNDEELRNVDERSKATRLE